MDVQSCTFALKSLLLLPPPPLNFAAQGLRGAWLQWEMKVHGKGLSHIPAWQAKVSMGSLLQHGPNVALQASLSGIPNLF